MSVPRDESIEQQLHRASALCDLRRYADALELLRAAIAADSQNASAWCLLVRAELGVNDVERGLQAARTAVSLAPEQSQPHLALSYALAVSADYEQAVRAAREAVRHAPHDGYAHAHLARVLVAVAKAGKKRAERRLTLEEAGSAARRAVELAPDDAESHLAAGAAAYAAGQGQEARDAFARALAIEPQNAVAHNELARLRMPGRRQLLDSEALAEAAGGFATAVRADPRWEAAARNVDVALRTFLSRLAYLIFLDAAFVARVGAHSTQVASRAFPLILLAIAARFAWRFVARLSQQLRRYIWEVLSGPGAIRRAAVVEAIAVVALIAGVVAPGSVRPGLAGVAALAGLIGRVSLFEAVRRAGNPGSPLLSEGALRLLATALALLAIAMAFAVANAHAGIGGVVFVVVCAGGCVATIRSVRRRTSRT
jgi:tetratricopeptide (TPR) repeat protein